jgi:hypothetical protein
MAAAMARTAVRRPRKKAGRSPAEQDDRIELDGGRKAEEDGGGDCEVAAVGEDAKGNDGPEDELDVGALDEEDEWEAE